MQNQPKADMTMSAFFHALFTGMTRLGTVRQPFFRRQMLKTYFSVGTTLSSVPSR